MPAPIRVWPCDPQPFTTYSAFIDPAGGSGQDSMTLAVGHQDGEGRSMLDLVAAIPPPFSPEGACEQFAAILKRYRIHRIVGDNYASEWPKEMMHKHGIVYERADKPKSAIYAEFLPLLNSRKVSHLEDGPLRKQRLGLEPRTAWGGRDTIDHPANGHDDVINAAAGVLVRIRAKSLLIMDLL